MAAAPNKKDEAYEKLSGTQKSAILMMLLGEEEASEILKNLSPREVQHLGAAMYSVQGLDQDTVNRGVLLYVLCCPVVTNLMSIFALLTGVNAVGCMRTTKNAKLSTRYSKRQLNLST